MPHIGTVIYFAVWLGAASAGYLWTGMFAGLVLCLMFWECIYALEFRESLCGSIFKGAISLRLPGRIAALLGIFALGAILVGLGIVALHEISRLT